MLSSVDNTLLQAGTSSRPVNWRELGKVRASPYDMEELHRTTRSMQRGSNPAFCAFLGATLMVAWRLVACHK
jgi:hypothetical protein